MTYRAWTTAHDRTAGAESLLGEAPVWEDRAKSGLVDPRGFSDIGDDMPCVDGRVCILVDMSGSNRGPHERIIALVDTMAGALEAAGVEFEVLGFTTSSWKGGRSRLDYWEERRAGRIEPAERPGRLCDLLHVVFKDKDASWTVRDGDRPTPREMLDALYRPGMLKEGLDGEAVRWALSRFEDKAGGRMIMVGDGFPMDESTASLNDGRKMLDEDLASALKDVSQAGVQVVRSHMHYSDPHHDLTGDVVVGGTRDPVRAVAVETLSRLSASPVPRP